MAELATDGERFMPGQMLGAVALEHYHRYLFAAALVQGRRVLDIASGEGYGTAILARTAGSVVGVDIDAAAVEAARSRHATDNLRFETGSCAAIPLPDSSIDVVVSFETIEHHDRHEEMLSEIRRVLVPDGLFIVSTPDRVVYSERAGFRNPFHVKELAEQEFRQLLGSRFRHAAMYRQKVLAGSWLLADTASAAPLDFFSSAADDRPASALAEAPYMVALASDAPLPVAHGGVLEGDLSELAAPMMREHVLRTASLLKAAALPGSRVLAACLDGDWYLRQYPDLASPGLDRVRHWLETGADEGRMPCENVVALMHDLVLERETSAGTGNAPTLRLGALEAAVSAIDRGQARIFDTVGQQAKRTLQAPAVMLEGLRAERVRIEQTLRAIADVQSDLLRQTVTELAERTKVGLDELGAGFVSAIDRSAAATAAGVQALDDQQRQLQSETLARLSSLLQASREAADLMAEGQLQALERLHQSLADTLAVAQARLVSLQGAVDRSQSTADALLAQLAEERSRTATLSQSLADDQASSAEREAQMRLAHEARISDLLQAQRDADARWTRLLDTQREDAAAELRSLQQRVMTLDERLVQGAAAAEAERSRAASQIRALEMALDASRAELASAFAKLGELSDRAQSEQSRLLAESNDLRGRLSQMQSSWSWRLTRPLRWRDRTPGPPATPGSSG